MTTELGITAALITELHDYGQRASEAVIALTSSGWYVRSNDDNPFPAVVTAEDITVEWLDDETNPGNTVDLDDDTAAEIAAAYAHLTIPHEDGSTYSPGTATVVIAFPGDLHGLDSDDTDAPHGAFWFDLNTARELVRETTTDPAREQSESLWRTAGGAYVVHVECSLGGRHDYWYDVTETEAAQRLYQADEDTVATLNGPLETAARHARDLVEALRGSIPQVRRISADLSRTDVEAAADVVAVAGILSELVRTTILPDLRAARAKAAWAVLADQGGNRAATHRLLAGRRDISARTVNDLLDNN